MDSRRFQVGLTVALLLFGHSTTAVANAIYDNLGAVSLNDFATSDIDGTAWEADDFSLAAADTVRSVRFTGVYTFDNSAIAADVFTVHFYTDSGADTPQNPAFASSTLTVASRVDTGANIGPSDVYEYQANLNSAVSLSAATTYWVAIVNDTTADLNDVWQWAGRGGTGLHSARADSSGNNWVARQFEEYDFTLSNVASVPEPSSAGNILMALAMVFHRTRRNKRGC